MTSPVSAVDITAMMERVWVFRDANYQRRWIDKPKVGATEFVRAAEVLALARQAEALQRENAELREALKPFAAHQTADGLSGPGSLLYIPNDHPILFNGLGNDVRVSVTVGHIRRARALLGGSDAE